MRSITVLINIDQLKMALKVALNVKAEIKILSDFYLAGLDSIFCHDWLTPRDAFCHAEYRLLILRRCIFLINMRFWDGLLNEIIASIFTQLWSALISLWIVFNPDIFFPFFSFSINTFDDEIVTVQKWVEIDATNVSNIPKMTIKKTSS